MADPAVSTEELDAALHRLDVAYQLGHTAQRNAWKQVRAALKRIKTKTLAAYPPPRRPRKRSPARARGPLPSGYRSLSAGFHLAVIQNKLPTKVYNGRIWVPEWVDAMLCLNKTSKEMRAAKRNRTKQEAAVAEYRLRGKGEANVKEAF